MRRSDDIAELAAALAACQGELPPVHKGTENTFFKSRYADLSDVVKVCAPVASRHGLAISQWPDSSTDRFMLITLLTHSSGQWIEGEMELHLAKLDSQAQGSAITYARRYAYCAALGVVSDADDDGNANRAPHVEPEALVAGDMRATLKRQIAGLSDEAKGRIKIKWKEYGIPPIDHLTRSHFGLADKLVQAEVIAAHRTEVTVTDVTEAFNLSDDEEAGSTAPEPEKPLEATTDAPDELLAAAVEAVKLMPMRAVDAALGERMLSKTGNNQDRRARLAMVLNNERVEADAAELVL